MSEFGFSKNTVAVSIVSHGHCDMLPNLLRQLAEKSFSVDHVILTHNTSSDLVLDSNEFPFKITTVTNLVPIGFGANHNQAFRFCDSDFFCVLNPDVEILEDPFDTLICCFHNVTVGVVAPLTFNSEGVLEDSVRFFPTPMSLVKKLVLGFKGTYPLESPCDLVFPDWVAGMFLLFRASVYKELHGFDKSYFLYCEDIDICLRVWKSRKTVVLSKGASIVHNAQRDSHSNRRFFNMHLISLFRFFYKHLFRFPR